MAAKAFGRVADSCVVPGLYASIHRHRAEGECKPDPRFDRDDEGLPWEQHQANWEQRVAQGRAAAEVLAQRRIDEGEPISVIWMHPGNRRDGIGVPDIALLTEGFPLRIMPSDVTEIDTDASADRRVAVNNVREQRGHPRIRGLEGPEWIMRVRQYLADGPKSLPDGRSHNGCEVV